MLTWELSNLCKSILSEHTPTFNSVSVSKFFKEVATEMGTTSLPFGNQSTTDQTEEEGNKSTLNSTLNPN